MPEESKRLFFGNPSKALDTQPFPAGERKCFGEKQIEPAKAPKVHPDAVMLAFGNHTQQPQPDAPFDVVNGQLAWSQKPRD